MRRSRQCREQRQVAAQEDAPGTRGCRPTERLGRKGREPSAVRRSSARAVSSPSWPTLGPCTEPTPMEASAPWRAVTSGEADQQLGILPQPPQAELRQKPRPGRSRREPSRSRAPKGRRAQPAAGPAAAHPGRPGSRRARTDARRRPASSPAARSRAAPSSKRSRSRRTAGRDHHHLIAGGEPSWADHRPRTTARRTDLLADPRCWPGRGSVLADLRGRAGRTRPCSWCCCSRRAIRPGGSRGGGPGLRGAWCDRGGSRQLVGALPHDVIRLRLGRHVPVVRPAAPPPEAGRCCQPARARAARPLLTSFALIFAAEWGMPPRSSARCWWRTISPAACRHRWPSFWAGFGVSGIGQDARPLIHGDLVHAAGQRLLDGSLDFDTFFFF